MEKQVEIERKYEVPVGFQLPDLTKIAKIELVEGPIEQDLDALYHDTATAALAAHRMTLRRRTGGHDAGWHLKCPSVDGERLETRIPLDQCDDADQVPAALVASIAGILGERELRPVARLRTRRLEYTARTEGGAVCALIADDVVHSEAAGANPVAKQWRELEVELAGEGDRALLAEIDAILRAAGAGPASTHSKLARAMARE